MARNASFIKIHPKFDNFGNAGVNTNGMDLCYDRGIMYRSSSRLWLLPDLAMDTRLLQPQADHFANFQSPPLPRFMEDEALDQFAARAVEYWLTDREIVEHARSRFFLGGIGFGGLLALEMAFAFASRSHPPAGIFLIGSARSDVNLASRSRLRLAFLSKLPPALGRWRLASQFRKLARNESMNESQTRVLQDMARDVDWAMVRWQVHAMLHWKRSRAELESSRLAIHQLHGRGDRIFRVPTVEDATVLIHGKHLINLSLSGEVNRWLESVLRDDDLCQTHLRNSYAT